jgi:hypothetical protein
MSTVHTMTKCNMLQNLQRVGALASCVQITIRLFCNEDKLFFLSTNSLGALGKDSSIMMALKWKVERR